MNLLYGVIKKVGNRLLDVVRGWASIVNWKRCSSSDKMWRASHKLSVIQVTYVCMPIRRIFVCWSGMNDK